jgi:hypothetical protein
MDKRLAKRHKRQVSRAKQNVRLSEPDVRTPEQVAAAKAVSGSDRSHENLNPWPSMPGDSGKPKKT